MDHPIDSLLKKYSKEFIELSLDKLDDIETELFRLEPGEAIGADRLAELKRDIHSIKGLGTTFGFPLVTRIAHLLEDYLSWPRRPDAREIRAFIEPMTDVLRAGCNPSPEESDKILRALPAYRERTESRPTFRNVGVHLAMKPGLRTKIVTRELTSCGFRVSSSDDAAKSLAIILYSLPDIVIASLELNAFSGVELAQLMNEIDVTRHIRFVLLTDRAKDDPRLSGLPENAVLVGTNTNYSYGLGKFLADVGEHVPADNRARSTKHV